MDEVRLGGHSIPTGPKHSQMWIGAGRTNSHVTRSVGIRSLDLPIYSPKWLGLVPFVAVVLHRLRVTNRQNVSEQIVATTRELITASFVCFCPKTESMRSEVVCQLLLLLLLLLLLCFGACVRACVRACVCVCVFIVRGKLFSIVITQ